MSWGGGGGGARRDTPGRAPPPAPPPGGGGRPRGRDGVSELPASFGQRRLWFLGELDEQARVAYNMPGGVRIRGDLDPGALGRAIGMVADRHEVLRTTFSYRDGELYQVIHPAGSFMLDRVDLRGRPAGEHAGVIGELVRAQAGTPFDLARGPLIRGTLVCTGDRDHTLLLGLHHAVADGWSLAVLLREIPACYEACVSGVPSGLAPLPVQYGDYAAWHRGREQAGGVAGQLEDWRGPPGGKAGDGVAALPVKGAGVGIDHRRSGDADFGNQVVVRAIAIAEITVGHGGGRPEVIRPEQAAGRHPVGVGGKG